jgi:hypothetical protein
MKIYRILLVLGYSLNHFEVLAQSAMPSIDYLKQGSLVREIAPAEAKMEGDFYLDSHWGQASILLYKADAPIDGYLARYNIKNDEIEFQRQDGARAIAGSKVKRMSWVDSLKKQNRSIVNARDYSLNGVPADGFFEVLQDGVTPAFRKVYLDIIKPTYNPSLAMGNKDFTVYRKEKYYYAIKNEIYLIKNRKSMDALDAVSSIDIGAYLKQESLNLGKEEDIKRLFQYLNATKE